MAAKTKKFIKLRKPQLNFVELLLIALMLVGLGTFAVVSVRDFQDRRADTERQRDIRTIQASLEDYYAQNERYPTLVQINTADWRSKELPDLQTIDTTDPNGKSWMLVPTSSKTDYTYTPTTVDGSVCDNTTVDCMKYSLSAIRSDKTLITRNNYN